MSEKIEALTQAAAPDMERDELPVPAWYSDGFQIKSVPFDHNGFVAVPLYSASQLSALQERAEKELAWRDRRIAVLDAAEARVAELEKERDEARHELWQTGLALGVIAKWPRVYFNRFYVEEWVLRTVTILKRWGLEFADGALTVEGSRSIRNSRLSRAALAHKGEGR